MAPLSKRILTRLVLAALLPFLTGATIVIRGPRVPAASALTRSDDFSSYTDWSALGDAANWTDSKAGLTVYGTTKVIYSSTAGGGAEDFSYWSGDTWSANHSSEITLYVSSMNSGIGPAVRVQGTGGSLHAYGAILWTDSRIYLIAINSGTKTGIADYAMTTPATDQKIRLSATGSGSATRLTLEVYQSGAWSALVSNLDPGGTYIDGGSPGITGLGNNSQGAKAWTGTEI